MYLQLCHYTWSSLYFTDAIPCLVFSKDSWVVWGWKTIYRESRYMIPLFGLLWLRHVHVLIAYNYLEDLLFSNRIEKSQCPREFLPSSPKYLRIFFFWLFLISYLCGLTFKALHYGIVSSGFELLQFSEQLHSFFVLSFHCAPQIFLQYGSLYQIATKTETFLEVICSINIFIFFSWKKFCFLD